MRGLISPGSAKITSARSPIIPGPDQSWRVLFRAVAARVAKTAFPKFACLSVCGSDSVRPAVLSRAAVSFNFQTVWARSTAAAVSQPA